MSRPMSLERVTAERIINGFYARIGKPPPVFLWFDDPLSCVLACNLLRPLTSDTEWARLWHFTFAPLRFKRPTGGQIRRNLWFQLEHQLRVEGSTHFQTRQSWNQPRGEHVLRFWGSFWNQLEIHIGSQLGRQLRAVLRAHAGTHAMKPAGDLHLLHEEGFWGGAVEGGPQQHDPHGPATARLHELQRACGWWSPRGNAVICSDRPRRILVDGQDRLHGEHGPATELSTAHRLYAWHGTRVLPEWIEQRDSLDPAIALGWQRVDERRAALEIVGWTKVLDRLTTHVIDADRDPAIGTLVECDVPGAGRSRFLRVRCGTGRDFVLSVPLAMKTALDANAWTYGLQSNEYQLEARS